MGFNIDDLLMGEDGSYSTRPSQSDQEHSGESDCFCGMCDTSESAGSISEGMYNVPEERGDEIGREIQDIIRENTGNGKSWDTILSPVLDQYKGSEREWASFVIGGELAQQALFRKLSRGALGGLLGRLLG